MRGFRAGRAVSSGRRCSGLAGGVNVAESAFDTAVTLETTATYAEMTPPLSWKNSIRRQAN